MQDLRFSAAVKDALTDAVIANVKQLVEIDPKV
jgi:hypothetical protein